MIKTLAAAALLAAPVAANAAEPVSSYPVEHADLDLTTEAGIARLDRRIERAARTLCASGRRDVQSLRFEAECRTDLIESTAAKVRLAITHAEGKQLARTSATTPKPGA